MIRYLTEKHSHHFLENLIDWYAGGPKEGGWTRTGPPIDFVEARLVALLQKQMLPVKDVLAKNWDEVNKWHLAFLDGSPQAYYSEYLDVRYNDIKADQRASTFLDMLEDMRSNGFDRRHPVCVADISELALGFRYFRFDGCHRTCCAKHLGIEEVPAYVFSIEVSSKTSSPSER